MTLMLPDIVKFGIPLSISPLNAYGIGCRGSLRALAMGVVKPANDDENFYTMKRERELFTPQPLPGTVIR